MSYYDGFATVDDPREYSNAPAMIMAGAQTPNPSANSPPPLPSISQAAISYAQDFQMLAADESQAYYAEQSNSGQRVADINNRLEVEYKMRDAASSIGKSRAADDRSSVVSTKSPKRISKSLMSPESKAEKRSNQQAADEIAVSNEKIREMERVRTDIERRKATVDRIISQHHAAVMSKASSNKPIPNHQRNRSGASNVSGITTNTQTSRRSWVMAPTHPPTHAPTHQPMHQPMHQRNTSATSNTGMPSTDSGSLATVTENVPHDHVPNDPIPNDQVPPRNPNRLSSPGVRSIISGHRRTPSDSPLSDPRNNSSGSALANPQSNKELEQSHEESNESTSRIAQASPQQSPAMNGKVAYVSAAFERVFRDLKETKNAFEASQIQIEHTESRISHLQKELEARQRASPVAPAPPAADGISMAESKHQLQEEKAFAKKWREKAEDQRRQSSKTTKSLEDVTKSSVHLEGERSKFEATLAHSTTKVADLEHENVASSQQRLSASSNTSSSCQEFQTIVSDLARKHSAESRSLYPVQPKSSDAASPHENSPHPQHSRENSMEHSIENSTPKSRANIESDSDSMKDAKHSSFNSRIDVEPLMQEPLDDKDIQSPPRRSPSRQSPRRHSASSPRERDSTDFRETYRGGDFRKDSSDHELAPPRARDFTNNESSRYDSSYENSIQYTDDSSIRPSLARNDTDTSELSKSSSYYPDGPSANPSYASVAGAEGRRAEASLAELRYSNYPRDDDDDDGLS